MSINDSSRRLAELSPEKLMLLSGRLKSKRSESMQPIAPRSTTLPYVPLSCAQERLWFLDQLIPGATIYNMPIRFRFREALDITAMQRSLNEIVRRHEAIRTTFTILDNKPVQVVNAPYDLPLGVEDLSHLPLKDRDRRVAELISTEEQEPFDLNNGPLIRVKVIRLEEQDHVILLSMHHIISDQWSMGILERELETLYTTYRAGLESPLEELRIQYGDYAIWQKAWLNSAESRSQMDYWRLQLEGLKSLELQTDWVRPANWNYRGRVHSFQLGEGLSSGLRDLGRQQGVTMYMLLLATFKAFLARYSGQDDIGVGTPIANRSRPEVKDLIGFFVNTLVLRTSLAGDPTFRQLVERVKAVTLEAYAHHEFPFDKLVEDLAPERSPSRNPLASMMFTFESLDGKGRRDASENLSPADFEIGTTRFDLEFNLYDDGRQLIGRVIYGSDLFSEQTIRRMVDNYQVFANAIVKCPDLPISFLEMLTQAERSECLIDWNATKSEYPNDKGIHELFEQQAERRSDSIALASDSSAITY